jgi:hypothetical protein
LSDVNRKKTVRREPWGWLSVLVGCALLAGPACAQKVDLGAIGDGGASMLWSATFERGDLSEWTGDGQGGTFNENTLVAPAVTTALAHGGRYAGALTFSPTASMPSTNYLFRDQPSPPEAFYSAWFYVPSTIAVANWLSLTHFRESQTGDGNNLTAAWDLNLYPRPDGSLAAQLYDYIHLFNARETTPIPVPVDTWVQFEVYLKKATDDSGQVIVWQDGALILERLGLPTVITDWVQWDAGGAADASTPGPATVYVDDATISTVRIGPGS